MSWSLIKKSTAMALVASAAFMSQAGAMTLDLSSARYLGLINDGIPSSLSNEVGYINTLLGRPSPSGPTLVGTETYTRTSNDCFGACPVAALLDAFKGDDYPSTIDLDDGWQYLLGKYDAAKAGAYVWYVGGLIGEVTIPDNLGTCGASGCGLSHISLFNPGPDTKDPPVVVPEPASLALVGLALAAMGAMTRRRRSV